jgi:hypothetical protein
MKQVTLKAFVCRTRTNLGPAERDLHQDLGQVAVINIKGK